MRICLFTMHQEATLGEMAALTMPNKLAYCQRHGYALHAVPWDGEGWPGFERLAPMIYLLRCGYYDWLFWLGTDCLITNQSLPLERLIDPAYGIVASADFTQIQLDSFLVQAGAGGLEMLTNVHLHRLRPRGQYYEQSTLESLMQEHPGVVKVLPQRAMNSFQHKWYADWPEHRDRIERGVDCNGQDGRWAPGDFIFHVPGRPYTTKMQALREVAHQVHF